MGRVLLDAVDSTNAEAMRRLPQLEGPCWILARRQTAGRGRRGRPWSDPDGNFAASLALRPGMDPQRAALLSFVASLALHESLGDLTAQPSALAIKWPNDLLAGRGKVAGILLEAAGTAGRADQLVIGIGVNLARAPAVVSAEAIPAVSLVAATGVWLRPETLLDRLAPAFDAWHRRLLAEGFAPLREAWLARAAGLGGPVTARTGREAVHGTFETIDESGALVLRTDAARRIIPAADVFF